MIELLFLKRRSIIGAKFFIISYITSVLSISAIIILIDGVFNYFNRSGFYYNQGFIVKTFQLTALGSFFAIIYSIVIINSDKTKSLHLITEFKRLFNNPDHMKIYDFLQNVDKTSMDDTLIKIKQRKDFEGGLVMISVQSAEFKLTGINTKKIDYFFPCIFLYSSGKTEKVTFNFNSVNDGNIKLQNIIYPLK